MFGYSFAYIYLILFESIIHEVLAFITVLDKGIFSLEKGSIGVQFYIDVENGHHLSTCKVNSWPKMCCLADEQYKDCSMDTIHGDSVELVKPKKRETFIYVYPTLYQYDQVGYCNFIVDFKCGTTKRSKQLDINIPFDTKISNKKKALYLKSYSDVKSSDCVSLDEDSLHDCKPVNCDYKYAGRRPFYEGSRSKCVNAPVCETNVMKKLPDIVYVPRSNICRDLDHPITIGDIYALSTGLGIVTESTISEKNDLKVLLKSNCSTISQNLILLRDLMYGKLCPLFNGDTSGYKECCMNAILSICGCIIAICGLLLSIACCIHTMVWCYKKWSTGELKNTIMTYWRSRIKKTKASINKPSHINREVTNNLLREVIVRDLPIELRDSVVDICQRIDHQVRQKKRYRVMDLGSQINLTQAESNSSTDTSETSAPDDEEKEKLIKKH